MLKISLGKHDIMAVTHPALPSDRSIVYRDIRNKTNGVEVGRLPGAGHYYDIVCMWSNRVPPKSMQDPKQPQEAAATVVTRPMLWGMFLLFGWRVSLRIE